VAFLRPLALPPARRLSVLTVFYCTCFHQEGGSDKKIKQAASIALVGLGLTFSAAAQTPTTGYAGDKRATTPICGRENSRVPRDIDKKRDAGRWSRLMRDNRCCTGTAARGIASLGKTGCFRELGSSFAPLPYVTLGEHHFVVRAVEDGRLYNIIPHRYLIDRDGRIADDRFFDALSDAEIECYRALNKRHYEYPESPSTDQGRAEGI
jgi:hypothetical protein